MARIGGTLGSGRIDDFEPVRKAAEEVGVSATTLKRWLTENKVADVVWGRDQRNWIFVKKDSIPKLRQYKNSVRIAG